MSSYLFGVTWERSDHGPWIMTNGFLKEINGFRTFERSNIDQTLVNLLLSLYWYGTSCTDEDISIVRVFCENDGPTHESLESKN